MSDKAEEAHCDTQHATEAVVVPTVSEQEPELSDVATDSPSEQVACADDNSESVIQQHGSDLIYALGTVKVRFPNTGIKKQFLSIARLLGVNERDYYSVFTNNNATKDRNKYLYLAEQVDWVLSIKDREQYELMPAAPQVLMSLIDSQKAPSDTLENVYSCVIGKRGMAKSDVGRTTVMCEQLYSHTLTELHNTIQEISTAQTTAIQDVIERLAFSPNMGVSRFDRARNFVAFRYPDIYEHTHKMQTGAAHKQSASLIKIDMSMFDSTSNHDIVDMTFTYQENSSGKHHYYYCRIDVTGLYPFINTAIQAFTPVQRLI